MCSQHIRFNDSQKYVIELRKRYHRSGWTNSPLVHSNFVCFHFVCLFLPHQNSTFCVVYLWSRLFGAVFLSLLFLARVYTNTNWSCVLEHNDSSKRAPRSRQYTSYIIYLQSAVHSCSDIRKQYIGDDRIRVSAADRVLRLRCSSSC